MAESNGITAILDEPVKAYAARGLTNSTEIRGPQNRRPSRAACETFLETLFYGPLKFIPPRFPLGEVLREALP